MDANLSELKFQQPLERDCSIACLEEIRFQESREGISNKEIFESSTRIAKLISQQGGTFGDQSHPSYAALENEFHRALRANQLETVVEQANKIMELIPPDVWSQSVRLEVSTLAQKKSTEGKRVHLMLNSRSAGKTELDHMDIRTEK